jgi:hypothetical protein
MNYNKKYLKYKNKYLELKNKYLKLKDQDGGKLGDFFNYSNDNTIESIYYIKSDKKLYIQWNNNKTILPKIILTTPIKSLTKINDKFIWITESGTIYITNKYIKMDTVPAITR